MKTKKQLKKLKKRLKNLERWLQSLVSVRQDPLDFEPYAVTMDDIREGLNIKYTNDSPTEEKSEPVQMDLSELLKAAFDCDNEDVGPITRITFSGRKK